MNEGKEKLSIKSELNKLKIVTDYETAVKEHCLFIKNGFLH